MQNSAGTLAKAMKIALYRIDNEAFFFLDNQLLFHFKASVCLDSREVNDLLKDKVLSEIVNIRETRRLGWVIARTEDTGSLACEGFTLFTLEGTEPVPRIVRETTLSNILRPGWALADYENSRIYISRFNKPETR